MGGVFNDRFFTMKWDRNFIIQQKPSIAYLELYALVTATKLWGNCKKLCNARIAIFCDNDSVRHMVNGQGASDCFQSMKLIRWLVWDGIKHNRRIWVNYVQSKKNVLADSLSRIDFKKFWTNTPVNMNSFPDRVPDSEL